MSQTSQTEVQVAALMELMNDLAELTASPFRKALEKLGRSRTPIRQRIYKEIQADIVEEQRKIGIRLHLTRAMQTLMGCPEMKEDHVRFYNDAVDAVFKNVLKTISDKEAFLKNAATCLGARGIRICEYCGKILSNMDCTGSFCSAVCRKGEYNRRAWQKRSLEKKLAKKEVYSSRLDAHQR